MKIEFIGNIYLQPFLNQQELNYLNSFSSGVHFDNSLSPFFGLYDISVSENNLLANNFIFDKSIDLERSKNLNPNLVNLSVLFPFFKSSINFTEKSIKFNLTNLKNKEEFIYFLEDISQSIFFYYNHFLKSDCHSKILDTKFFHFFNSHNILGNLYFKLSEFGEMYRFTCSNEKIFISKGKYPIQIKGKNYLIDSNELYDIPTNRQLQSLYNKLSVVDIKNNAIFEEYTVFTYTHSEELNKLLHFHTLSFKFPYKAKNKINKI